MKPDTRLFARRTGMARLRALSSAETMLRGGPVQLQRDDANWSGSDKDERSKQAKQTEGRMDGGKDGWMRSVVDGWKDSRTATRELAHQIVRHRSRLFLIAWRHVGGPFATRRMRHRLVGVLLSKS